MLRELELRDAPLMLEWMHDPSVVRYMRADFSGKTIDDCRRFITESRGNEKDCHLAIQDDQGTYLGTVSLKNIHDRTAEFAITIRAAAMGKGYSKRGMAEILRLGLEEKGLDEIYWYVDRENERAIRFYDKNGYPRVSPAEIACIRGQSDAEENEKYIWYKVTSDRKGKGE